MSSSQPANSIGGVSSSLIPTTTTGGDFVIMAASCDNSNKPSTDTAGTTDAGININASGWQ